MDPDKHALNVHLIISSIQLESVKLLLKTALHGQETEGPVNSVIMDTDLSTPTVKKFVFIAVVQIMGIGIVKIIVLYKENGPTEETTFSIPVP